MRSQPDLTWISLGAGVQSTTLYRMAAVGEIGPRPDVAFFADTQQEPPWVYDNLEQLEREHGDVIPIVRDTAGDLREAIELGISAEGGRFASVPFWTRGADGREAPGRRQCTREYKIRVVVKMARTRLGLRPRQVALGKFRGVEWVGISLDEATRAKDSRYGWISTRWPLLERRMRRRDCERWLRARGFSVPKKSACLFCPWRSAAEYARWREEEPELFEAACAVDVRIRASGRGMRGVKTSQYVTRLLIPLRDLPPYEELRATREDDAQIDLFENECEGHCGV